MLCDGEKKACTPGQVITRPVLIFRRVTNKRVSGLAQFSEAWGLLAVVTSREDPRWGCHPFSWPTSLRLITHSNLYNLPVPLFSLSWPCSYCVHFGFAAVEEAQWVQSFCIFWTPCSQHVQCMGYVSLESSCGKSKLMTWGKKILDEHTVYRRIHKYMNKWERCMDLIVECKGSHT